MCNSQNALNSNLETFSNWVYQWKLQFNSDPKKQPNEVIFSCKSDTYIHPPVKFSNNTITKCSHQMHVGVALDSKLAFNIHIEQKIKKCNEIIRLIRKISVSLQIKAFLTIYRSFVRPHLDDGDVLYDKPRN